MMQGLSLAQVLRYYPESNTADIIRIEDGWRAARVPVMTGQASTDTGLSQVAAPEDISVDGVATSPDARSVVAVVAYHDRGAPIILGFLPPVQRQTLFTDGRYINRLASDVYTSVDKNGNAEWYHPSGTFVRIAEDPGHEDLTGQDFNGRWRVRRNTGRRPTVQVSVGNGGTEQASLTIDPAGNVTIATGGTVTLVTPSATISGDLIVGGRMFAAGGISTPGNVSDGIGTLGQLRVSHDGHGHGTPTGQSTPPNAGPPSFLPPLPPLDIEREQQGEDTYSPPIEQRDDLVSVITLPQYFRGFDAVYPDDYTAEVIANAVALLARVNALLQEAGIARIVTSGWRPLAYNLGVPGASATSLHIVARAIDLGDADRRLKFWLARNQGALERNGLFMETPAATPTWVHLQDSPPASGRRIFSP
ncbi:hypothetical protein [Nevskia sp.]|uniref:hypothetical protein n=1 Tax=Nevskia sp. TaxID=1929292 RepID=UPI0025CE4816|nr:hypothetical protein [Nevskia sp.]